MPSSLANCPIGIFDSGIGGLTVARAVTQLLPQEHIVYFGDTAHLPYGDKSAPAIQAYSIKICDFLLKEKCKFILIACNSASAAAYELIKEYVGKKAIVLDVINPTINHLREHFEHSRLGLIGTKQTIRSGIHQKKMLELNMPMSLRTLETPLLAPMIEEGFCQHAITESILHEYLSNTALTDIDALILACTHYPLIKEQIAAYYQGRVTVIDTSDIVARALKAGLEYHDLLNHTTQVSQRFYVSDFTPSFKAATELFFNQKVPLEEYRLWE